MLLKMEGVTECHNQSKKEVNGYYGHYIQVYSDNPTKSLMIGAKLFESQRAHY